MERQRDNASATTQLKLNLLEIEKPQEVAIVIPIRFDEENGLQVLLSQRTDSHLMTFPGGKLNTGETSRKAALRELEEETGYKLHNDDLVSLVNPRIVQTSSGKLIRVHSYYFQPEDHTLDTSVFFTRETDKHLDWNWYSLHEARKLILANKLPLATLTQDQIIAILESIFKTRYSKPPNDNIPFPNRKFRECSDYVFTAELESFVNKYL